MKLSFSVEGKPPKKDGGTSLWSEKSKQSPLVFKLRAEAVDAKKQAGLKGPFHGNLKLELKVFSPYITYKDQHNHVGDLDTLIAGVFEAIQPAPKNETLNPNPIFKTNPDIDPEIPIITEDDSQIISVKSEKIKSDKIYYTVFIETVSD